MQRQNELKLRKQANRSNLQTSDQGEAIVVVDDEAVDTGLLIEAKFKAVVAKHGDIFNLKNKKIVCSYCATLFDPLQPHGDVVTNTCTHINTDGHKAAVSKGTKQSSLSSFFKPAPKEKTDA